MKREKTSSKLLQLASISICCALLAGCETRSISDSGYSGHRGGFMYGERNSSGYTYRGELNEYDVLGIERTQTVTEGEITAALDNAGTVRVPKGSSILLIQSGARFPDDAMVQELSKYYNVTPFPGVPESEEGASYAKTLRLAAARGKHQAIICYWGILETAQQNLASKPLAWVPLVGFAVPDEKQHMRIRLKMAVIDVRSGNWSLFYAQPFGDGAVSNFITRKNADQRQVQMLKDKAYPAAAQQLVTTYAPN